MKIYKKTQKIKISKIKILNKVIKINLMKIYNLFNHKLKKKNNNF